MSTLITSPPSASLPPEPPARLTVRQYHAMLQAGVFAEDEEVELLEGWLFHKSAKKATHSVATRSLRKKLEMLMPSGWDVDSQEPITTLESEPEPDVSVVRAGARGQEMPPFSVKSAKRGGSPAEAGWHRLHPCLLPKVDHCPKLIAVPRNRFENNVALGLTRARRRVLPEVTQRRGGRL